MNVPQPLLSVVIEVAVGNLTRMLESGLDQIMLQNIWDNYAAAVPTEEARLAEVRALAACNPDVVSEAVERLAQSACAAVPELERVRLTCFLEQLVGRLRRLGVSQENLCLRDVRDLEALIPPTLPRFKPGDKAGGVRYLELVRLLSMGRMGEVWLARNARQNPAVPVVLKFCSSEEARAALSQKEDALRVVMGLKDQLPGMAALREVHPSADPPFLEYEQVKGEGFAWCMNSWRQRGLLTPLRVADVMARLAETVGNAHAQSPPLAHGDLKASTIVVQQREVVGGDAGKHGPEYQCRVLELGSGWLGRGKEGKRSSLEEPTWVPGQPTASPRSPTGEPTPREDVYALGVLWYQTLTGDFTRPAPSGDGWQAPLSQQGMSTNLIDVLASCVAADPEKRPANGREMAARIAGARPRNWRPIILGLALTVLLPLLLALGAWWLTRSTDNGSGLATTPPKEEEVKKEDPPVKKEEPPVKKEEPPVKKEDPPVKKEDPPVKKSNEIVNAIGMRFVRVVADSFLMGSTDQEQDEAIDDFKRWSKRDPSEGTIARYRSEGPQRKVEITRDLWMGVFEVTQGQYQRVMGRNPSHFSALGKGRKRVQDLDTSEFPVEMVSWDEAVAFCEKLNAMVEEREKKHRYRLPTEAEWEFACRGGHVGTKPDDPFQTGKAISSAQANFNGEHPFGKGVVGRHLNRTCKVGSYAPNALGLYDLHGNVYEWCQDYYGEKFYAEGPRTDPTGPDKGTMRVLRGGNWDSDGADCRSANRDKDRPGARSSLTGFRVVLEKQ